jgi:hypothetical protein
MSAELKAISNIMSGVNRATGKGGAGLARISKSIGKTAKAKDRDKAKKAKDEDRKTKSDKKSSSKSESTKTTTVSPSSNKPKSSPTKRASSKGKTPGVNDVRTALGSGKISIEEASNLNPKGTSTPLSRKPSIKDNKSDTFTPKSKKKPHQPSLPGMSKAKIKAL